MSRASTSQAAVRFARSCHYWQVRPCREIERSGLLVRINAREADTRIRFHALALHYLEHDCGPDALRPKTERTVLNTSHIVHAYLIPQWGEAIADDVKPIDIQHWLKTLHAEKGLAWTTISKFRGTMLRIYRIGALHQLVERPTKTRRSEGHVPMHPALAQFLLAWKEQTPYAKETDFIFPSFKSQGRVPVSPAVFIADHLRPAANGAGIRIPDGCRFGLHNLRHSLSSWLVNKGKADPKTVQSLLRHSRIQTTLDLYTQGDGDETRAAQGAFLREMGLATEKIQ